MSISFTWTPQQRAAVERLNRVADPSSQTNAKLQAAVELVCAQIVDLVQQYGEDILPRTDARFWACSVIDGRLHLSPPLHHPEDIAAGGLTILHGFADNIFMGYLDEVMGRAGKRQPLRGGM